MADTIKAGYVAVIGKPNTGKSTLMNKIIGARLSIVTHKPQTTRRSVTGIYTSGNFQAVFLDTPGIVRPQYELHKVMLDYIDNSIKKANVLLCLAVADRAETPQEAFTEDIWEKLQTTTKPKILLINKIDRLKNVKQVLPIIDEYAKTGVFQEIAPISGLKDSGVSDTVELLKKYLPESDFIFDPEYLSNQPERFFAAEFVRENVFKFYKQEIPYSTDVQIREFKERENGKTYIAADVVVERESHKAIIIGEGGKMIKKLSQTSRIDIEEHLQREVFLELFVKTREKWRNKKGILKSLGY